MKKIWVRKFESFKSARKFDIDYYLSMSSSERLENMQHLREIALKLKNGKGRKGLRRVVRIIK